MVTWIEGFHAFGEGVTAVGAEISGEEREPDGEELRSDPELRLVVVEQERVVGSSSGVVAHGGCRVLR